MMVCRRRKCDFTAIFDLAAADGRGPAPPPQPSHRGDQPVRIGPPVDAGALQRGTRPGTCTMTSPAPGGVPSIHGGVPSMLVDAMLQSVLGDGGSPAVTPSAADGVATAGPAAVPTPVGSDGDAIDRRVYGNFDIVLDHIWKNKNAVQPHDPGAMTTCHDPTRYDATTPHAVIRRAMRGTCQHCIPLHAACDVRHAVPCPSDADWGCDLMPDPHLSSSSSYFPSFVFVGSTSPGLR